MNLELVRTATEVGSFYADIVRRDTDDGSKVVIEHHFERGLPA